MYIFNELKVRQNSNFMPEIRTNFLDILYYVTEHIISDKSMFELDDFLIKYFDEFTLETNCHKDIVNTLYFEINQPANYKLSKIKNTKKKDGLKFPELYMSLEDFSESIYSILIKTLDSNNILWREDNNVFIRSIITENDSAKDIYFKIIPCISYFNSSNKKGQFYRKNGGLEIDYIDDAIINFNKKNSNTNGIYKDTILIFKNILLKDKKTNNLPTEIIETMLYNVPDIMYNDLSKKSMLGIINYLRNNSIKSFKTIDEQDLAFVSEFKSMSIIYVKHILKLIEKYFSEN